MIKELIMKNRSYRRFYEDRPISKEELCELVDLTRFSASASNKQPLKYILSCNPGMNSTIFNFLSWAAYIKDWDGPEEGERPGAYIIVLGDISISPTINCDHGIAAQSILLGATEMGFGGCIIHYVQREGLRSALKIEEKFEILLVIALGVPKENVVIEEIGPDGSIIYWRDEQGIHHVPKRSLAELILNYSA